MWIWTPQAGQAWALMCMPSVPAVGVAKTPFRTAPHAARVFRGRSARPLYVTAAGMTIAEAARRVEAMAGRFRLPGALKLAGRLARGFELPVGELSSPTAAG